MAVYEVTQHGLELPHGERFTISRSPVAAGDLCLFMIGQHMIIGRLIADMIIQPHRWIYISAAIVKCVGKVALLMAL